MTSRPAAAQRLRDLARLRRGRDRIDREHAQPLDIGALARGMYMSAGHLSREFRLAYGESPSGYLMTRRIARAMTLLRRGDRSLLRGRLLVAGHLQHPLHPAAGMTPSTYRRHAARATAGIRRASHSRRPDRSGIKKRRPRSRS